MRNTKRCAHRVPVLQLHLCRTSRRQIGRPRLQGRSLFSLRVWISYGP